MTSSNGGFRAPREGPNRGPAVRRGSGSPTAADCRSADDGIVALNGRGGTEWIVPLGLAACYLVLAAVVHLRALDFFDLAVDRAARPGGVWGPLQIRATRVADALQPVHVAAALLIVVVALCVPRRSLRPVAVVATVGVPVAIVTLGTKWVMAHSTAATAPIRHGGFPSGHTASVITVFGVLVLVVRPGTRWGWLLPTLMGCLMGSALVLADIHPATDVLGAGLLAAAALTAAQAAGLGQWADVRQRGRAG